MTEEIKDGGQAFPRPIVCSPMGDLVYAFPGMSLRDYFAADAPITVWDAQMALNKGTTAIGSLPSLARKEVFEMMAKLRFEYADAMVAASEVK